MYEGPDIDVKFAKRAFFGIMIAFITLIGSVILSGQTFGQRCSKAGYEGSDRDACVERLSKFGVLHVKDLPSWTKE